MTRKNKIGGIFLASMLALAGLGISYAGFSDTIYVFGTVGTATVELEIIDYSGTWVWKVWGTGAPPGEVEIFRGLTSVVTDAYMTTELGVMYPGCQYQKVSWAYAQPGTGNYDVDMIYHNIFPCTEYTADVWLHYTGSIPVKADIINQQWDEVFDIPDLWDINFYATKGVLLDTGNYQYTLTTLPVQLHYCNRLQIVLGIHMLQPENVNNYQGQTYTFSFDIYALQWNEQLPYYYMPKDIGSGSLSITGTGWTAVYAWLNPTGYNFAANRYSFDIGCQPIALQGFVDTSQAAKSNTGDWSKYFQKFSIRDDSNRVVNVVFCNSWLGDWYEIPAHAWDRISLETENVPGFMSNTQHAEQWYATQGGVLGYNMNGQWVGEGNGAMVYPSDQNYFFQLIADPEARTFTLEVYAMGSSAPANPPTEWPKQNMYDYSTWLQIGSITIGAGNFNFGAVEFYAALWASTQAGQDDSSTVSWNNMCIGVPVSFSEVP